MQTHEVGEQPVMAEAEIGAMHLPTTERQGLWATCTGWERGVVPWGLQRGQGSAHTLILAFYPPDL